MVYPTDIRVTEELTDNLESRLQDIKNAHVLMEKSVKDVKTLNSKLKVHFCVLDSSFYVKLKAKYYLMMLI